MKKIIWWMIFLFVMPVLFISCLEQKAKEQQETEDYTIMSDTDELLYATTINNAGDTLRRRYNNTRKTLLILFKGDSIWLKQDTMASGIKYSNSQYSMNEWQGTTMLKKEDETIFLYPSVKQ